MSDRRATIIAPRVAREIDEAADRWKRNRPAAKRAFHEELQRALDLVSTYPSVGFKAVNLKLVGVRRIYLSRIQDYLYYRLSSDDKTVEIPGLWHAKRGPIRLCKPSLRGRNRRIAAMERRNEGRSQSGRNSPNAENTPGGERARDMTKLMDRLKSFEAEEHDRVISHDQLKARMAAKIPR